MKNLIRNVSISLIGLSAVCGNALALQPNCMYIVNNLKNSAIDDQQLKDSYVIVDGGSLGNPYQAQEYWVAPGQKMMVCGIASGNLYNPWYMGVTAAPGDGQSAYPSTYIVSTIVWLDGGGAMSSYTGSITARIYYTSPDGTIQYSTKIDFKK